MLDECGGHMGRVSMMMVVGLCLAFSACGENGSRDDQKGQQSVLPCDVLKAEDILQVTGHAMHAGEEKYGIFCHFTSVEENQMQQPKYSWHVQLVHHANDLESEVKQYQASMKQGLGADAKDYTEVQVPGIGDRAWWESFAGLVQLVVFKADNAGATTVLMIQPDFQGKEQAKSVAGKLAARAIERL